MFRMSEDLRKEVIEEAHSSIFFLFTPGVQRCIEIFVRVSGREI